MSDEQAIFGIIKTGEILSASWLVQFEKFFGGRSGKFKFVILSKSGCSFTERTLISACENRRLREKGERNCNKDKEYACEKKFAGNFK